VGGGAQNYVNVYNSFGGNRNFNLVLPERYDTDAPRTLLIAVHGGTVLGDRYMRDHKIDVKGAAAGFVVAAPNALFAEWMMRNGPNDGPPDLAPGVDDVAFVGDMVRCIAAMGVPLNMNAVLSGYSLGGMFAGRIACTPPAGLTVVALAAAGGIQSASPHNERTCVPTSLMLFEGGAETQVPLCKRATIWGNSFSYAPLMPRLEDWVRYNGGEVGVREPTQCAADDGTRVYTWGGNDATEKLTVLVWIPDGGHIWPRQLAGCPGDTAGIDASIAFYQSALAGTPQPVAPFCAGGFTPCERDLPCAAPTAGDWVTSLR
jgi:poly(3-hydroxybutyrate) depolymerase